MYMRRIQTRKIFSRVYCVQCIMRPSLSQFTCMLAFNWSRKHEYFEVGIPLLLIHLCICASATQFLVHLSKSWFCLAKALASQFIKVGCQLLFWPVVWPIWHNFCFLQHPLCQDHQAGAHLCLAFVTATHSLTYDCCQVKSSVQLTQHWVMDKGFLAILAAFKSLTNCFQILLIKKHHSIFLFNSLPKKSASRNF